MRYANLKIYYSLLLLLTGFAASAQDLDGRRDLNPPANQNEVSDPALLAGDPLFPILPSNSFQLIDEANVYFSFPSAAPDPGLAELFSSVLRSMNPYERPLVWRQLPPPPLAKRLPAPFPLLGRDASGDLYFAGGLELQRIDPYAELLVTEMPAYTPLETEEYKIRQIDVVVLKDKTLVLKEELMKQNLRNDQLDIKQAKMPVLPRDKNSDELAADDRKKRSLQPPESETADKAPETESARMKAFKKAFSKVVAGQKKGEADEPVGPNAARQPGVADSDNRLPVDQRQPRSDVGILDGGMVIDETHTRMGRDFYSAFYKVWQPPQGADNFMITISEKMVPSMGTIVSVQLDGETIFRARVQPNFNSAQQIGRSAAQVCYQRLQQMQGQAGTTYEIY